ncbi:hypothetical protein HZB01_04885 [Candidatus Woesearchaeota archaeon]|nr:hypothetical protein [Candidatus Woesearchaeota archaeon]
MGDIAGLVNRFHAALHNLNGNNGNIAALASEIATHVSGNGRRVLGFADITGILVDYTEQIAHPGQEESTELGSLAERLKHPDWGADPEFVQKHKKHLMDAHYRRVRIEFENSKFGSISELDDEGIKKIFTPKQLEAYVKTGLGSYTFWKNLGAVVVREHGTGNHTTIDGIMKAHPLFHDLAGNYLRVYLAQRFTNSMFKESKTGEALNELADLFKLYALAITRIKKEEPKNVPKVLDFAIDNYFQRVIEGKSSGASPMALMVLSTILTAERFMDAPWKMYNPKNEWITRMNECLDNDHQSDGLKIYHEAAQLFENFPSPIRYKRTELRQAKPAGPKHPTETRSVTYRGPRIPLENLEMINGINHGLEGQFLYQRLVWDGGYEKGAVLGIGQFEGRIYVVQHLSAEESKTPPLWIDEDMPKNLNIKPDQEVIVMSMSPTLREEVFSPLKTHIQKTYHTNRVYYFSL